MSQFDPVRVQSLVASGVRKMGGLLTEFNAEPKHRHQLKRVLKQLRKEGKVVFEKGKYRPVGDPPTQASTDAN